MVARIYLGDAVWKTVWNTATTFDNTRVYAAVSDVQIDRPGGVAVIDAIRLEQFDVDPVQLGDNFIPLPDPTGAQHIVLSPRNDFLYAVDEGRAIYVIDVRPDSPGFHNVIHTIDLPDGRQFMDGMAISSDGHRLYVSTVGGQPARGSIVVINVDPADQPPDPNANLTSESENPRFWHQLIRDIPDRLSVAR